MKLAAKLLRVRQGVKSERRLTRQTFRVTVSDRQKDVVTMTDIEKKLQADSGLSDEKLIILTGCH